MADKRSAGWMRLTKSGPVTDQPALLHAVVLLCSSTGGSVSIYEGRDASVGRLILTLEGYADVSRPVAFPVPVRAEAGLYVDVGSNVSEVLVVWEPMQVS